MKTAVWLLLSVPAIFYRVWVVSKGWGWFITPTFGLAVPGYAVIFGLLVLLCYATPGAFADNMATTKMAEDADMDRTVHAAVLSYGYTTIVLALLSLAHFMGG